MREVTDRMMTGAAPVTTERKPGLPFWTIICPYCAVAANVQTRAEHTCAGCGAKLQPEKKL